MDRIKIYRQDGTFYETDNYEVITINSKDVKDFVECDNGVKVIHKDDKEFFIENATIKNSVRNGLSYRNVELKII